MAGQFYVRFGGGCGGDDDDDDDDDDNYNHEVEYNVIIKTEMDTLISESPIYYDIATSW